GEPGDQKLQAALAEAAGRSFGGAVAVDMAAARFRVGDPAAETELKNALNAQDPMVRLRAAVSLAEAGKIDAAKLRESVLGAPPTARRVLRQAGLLRLVKLGDQPTTDEMKKALTSSDAAAKLDAAQALARGNDPAAAQALADLSTAAPDTVD